MKFKLFMIIAFFLLLFMGADWPVAVKTGDPLILSAEQEDSTWSILPLGWKKIVFLNTNQVVFDTSESGVISIVLTDSNGVLLTHHQVIVGDGNPSPNPGPEPNPEPEPEPIEHLFGLVLYQSEEIDDREDAAKISQVILGNRLRKLDDRFTWRPIEMDSVDEDGNIPEADKPWIDLVNEENLEIPLLILVNQKGDAIDSLPLPNSVDTVIGIVRKVLPE